MEPQTNNLNTLRILFIIKGVFNLLIALFFLAYGFIMRAVFSGNYHSQQELLFDIGTFFWVIAGIGFVCGLAFAILTLLAAKYIGHTKNYSFIFVISILNCLTGILGILLGVFTLIELNKPHVKVLFEQNSKKA